MDNPSHKKDIGSSNTGTSPKTHDSRSIMKAQEKEGSGSHEKKSVHFAETQSETQSEKKSVHFAETQSEKEMYSAEEYDRESIIKKADIPEKLTKEADKGIKRFNAVYNEIKELRDKFDTKSLIEYTGIKSEDIDNLENEFNSAHQRYDSAVEISKSPTASTDRRIKNASYVPFYELMKVTDKAANIQGRLERGVEKLEKQEQQALPYEPESQI